MTKHKNPQSITPSMVEAFMAEKVKWKVEHKSENKFAVLHETETAAGLEDHQVFVFPTLAEAETYMETVATSVGLAAAIKAAGGWDDSRKLCQGFLDNPEKVASAIWVAGMINFAEAAEKVARNFRDMACKPFVSE